MTFSTPDFAEKTLTSSDGTNIYAIAAGNPKHSALVFIHGFGLSSLVFEGLLRESALLDKFYLVAYDVRGHGRSGKSDNPEDHQSSLYAADFDAVLKAFEVTKPLIVAWSMGGIVVADVCAHLPPGTIAGIAYVNAAPYLGEALVKVGSPYILEVLPLLLSTDNVAASCEARIKFVEACFSKPDTLPAQLKWSWIGATVMQPPIVAALTVSRSQDASKLLEAAEGGLPTLAIVSTADLIIQGNNVEEMLKGHFKKLEVHRIENGSHTPFIDDKDEFVTVLTEFATKTFCG